MLYSKIQSNLEILTAVHTSISDCIKSASVDSHQLTVLWYQLSTYTVLSYQLSTHRVLSYQLSTCGHWAFIVASQQSTVKILLIWQPAKDSFFEYWCMQHVRGLGDDMLCNDSLHYIITDSARVMKDDVNYIPDREERWLSSPSVLAAESVDLMCCEYTARRLPRSSVLHTQTTYTTSSHPQPRHPTTRPRTPQVLQSAIHNLAIHTTRPRTPPQVPHSAIHNLAIHTTRPRTPQVPHSAIHNLAIHTTRHIINILCVSDSVSISRISLELTPTLKCQKMSPLYVTVTLIHMNQLTTNMAILLPIKNLITATNIQHTINIQWLQYCNTAALFQCACTTLVHKLRPPCLQP